MKTLMRYIRKQALVVTVLVVVVAAAVTTLAFAADSSEPAASILPPAPPFPTPVTSPSPFDVGNCTSCRMAALIREARENAAGKSDEEVAAIKGELIRQLEQQGLKVFDYNSPEAFGAEITLAGKLIKLPEDARIKGVAFSGMPVFTEKGCLNCEAVYEDYPCTHIVRGNSEIIVTRTGKIGGGLIDPNELGAFDFLKEVFPEQSEAIDLLPIRVLDKSPQTSIINSSTLSNSEAD